MLRTLREYCDDIALLAPLELAPDAAARRNLSRALVALFSGIMVPASLLHSQSDYEAMVAVMRNLLRFRPEESKSK